MKIQHIFLIVLVMVLMSFCKHKNEAANQESDSIAVVEKDSDTIGLIDTVQVRIEDTKQVKNNGVKPKEENIIRGNAFYKLRYCGGARPTPEIEEKYQKEYPLASQKIKFVNVYDDKDFVNTATDANGGFSAELHEGVYNYYIVFTQGSSLPPNPNCQKYFEHTYGKIFVDSIHLSGFKLLYSFPCDPCSSPKP